MIEVAGALSTASSQCVGPGDAIVRKWIPAWFETSMSSVQWGQTLTIDNLVTFPRPHGRTFTPFDHHDRQSPPPIGIAPAPCPAASYQQVKCQ